MTKDVLLSGVPQRLFWIANICSQLHPESYDSGPRVQQLFPQSPVHICILIASWSDSRWQEYAEKEEPPLLPFNTSLIYFAANVN